MAKLWTLLVLCVVSLTEVSSFGFSTSFLRPISLQCRKDVLAVAKKTSPSPLRFRTRRGGAAPVMLDEGGNKDDSASRFEKDKGGQISETTKANKEPEESSWEEVKSALKAYQGVLGIKLVSDEDGEPSPAAWVLMGANLLLPLLLVYQVFAALSGLVKGT